MKSMRCCSACLLWYAFAGASKILSIANKSRVTWMVRRTCNWQWKCIVSRPAKQICSNNALKKKCLFLRLVQIRRTYCCHIHSTYCDEWRTGYAVHIKDELNEFHVSCVQKKMLGKIHFSVWHIYHLIFVQTLVELQQHASAPFVCVFDFICVADRCFCKVESSLSGNLRACDKQKLAKTM